MFKEDGTFVNSKKEITFNEGNTMNIMVPLIPFNCLFDTDVGLIKLINMYYNDPSVFDQNTLDSLSTNLAVTKFVFNSTSSNILLDIMIDKNKEIADEYYRQFMQEEYADILRNSVATDISYLFQAMQKQADIKVTVFCERFEEVNFIHEYIDKTIQAVELKELSEHFNIYKQFYFKSCHNDYYFKSICGRISKSQVYILDYARNFDSEGNILISDAMKALKDKYGIHFSIINTYSRNFNEGED